MPDPTARDQPYDRPQASYGFSSIDSAFGHVDRFQTVEQVIANGYFAAPAGDPITAVITDRHHTSWLGLDDVIRQVRQRYEIHERNLYRIESAKCAAINAIYHHEAYNGTATASSKQHYAKHKAIQGLYEEERLERVNLWRDVSRIKQLLPESAQQYLAAHRKVSVLAENRGDAP